MDLTTDDKKLAYFIAKLPLTTKVIENHIKDLVKLLQSEKRHYESQFEDPERNLWELPILISHFEDMLRSFNSVSFRLHIRELETTLANKLAFLKKTEND